MFTTATAGGPLYCNSVTSTDYCDVKRTRSVLSDIIIYVNDFIRLTFDGKRAIRQDRVLHSKIPCNTDYKYPSSNNTESACKEPINELSDRMGGS